MEAKEFLGKLYAIENPQSAATFVIDEMDRLHSAGLFNVSDEILQEIDFRRMPSSLRRAVLTITYPAKDMLPTRTTRYNDALQILTEERGEKTAKQMLRTLA